MSYMYIGFTTKFKIDEEVELGSKGPLDNRADEPNMYVNPKVIETADPKDEKPVASNGNQHNT